MPILPISIPSYPTEASDPLWQGREVRWFSFSMRLPIANITSLKNTKRSISSSRIHSVPQTQSTLIPTIIPPRVGKYKVNAQNRTGASFYSPCTRILHEYSCVLSTILTSLADVLWTLFRPIHDDAGHNISHIITTLNYRVRCTTSRPYPYRWKRCELDDVMALNSPDMTSKGAFLVLCGSIMCAGPQQKCTSIGCSRMTLSLCRRQEVLVRSKGTGRRSWG
jgi:hypothetical protein